MSPRRLVGISGKEVLRALRRAGFELARTSGSHHVLRKAGPPAQKVIVPLHGAHDLPPGTVRSIIEQAGMTIDEFIQLL